MQFHIQSTVFGQFVRLISRNGIFRYPDEIDPSLWEQAVGQDAPSPQREQALRVDGGIDKEEQRSAGVAEDAPEALIVGWYGPADPENPQNWPDALKHLIAFQMCLLNFAVYIASSIYVPGESSLIEEFGVSETVATLGLSLFTFGYGIGPMLWSPLSEMPVLGRSRIFVGTLFAFIIFQLPVGLAPNIAVFLVFRFLTGFCGSPCLATGGGTLNDMYPPTQVPYLLLLWQSAGVLGPIFGPVIGGYLAPAKGWRWTIWVFTILCSFVLVAMFFLLPETSAGNILYNRAGRLRKATGKDRLRSQTEVDSAHHGTKDHLMLLARAFTVTFTEPIILFVDLYAGLLYGVLFIWFESFPIVFGGIYGFTIGQQGLVFLSILVFASISVAAFLLWINKRLVPLMLSKTFKPEMVLPPTVVGGLALPICLFWFGWTSRESVHWIAPVIGSGLFGIGVTTLFNSVYTYIGIVYARHSASVFAGAALFRALLGGAFPLFARSLFYDIGIGPGNSLLGGLAVLFIPIPFVIYRYGERIRGWSKHAD
ncbi:MFS general substrate transporter [Nemania serpens]|nr:MFS general substrate transporter [Nemania serpens]